jgi:hypothetical protein
LLKREITQLLVSGGGRQNQVLQCAGLLLTGQFAQIGGAVVPTAGITLRGYIAGRVRGRPLRGSLRFDNGVPGFRFAFFVFDVVKELPARDVSLALYFNRPNLAALD